MKLSNSINHFLSLLKSRKLEDSIKIYMDDSIQINHNGKNKKIKHSCWIRFLRKIFLNENTSILQLEICDDNIHNNSNAFVIHIICKKKNGQLFLTEIQVQNTWIGSKISKLSYNTIHF